MLMPIAAASALLLFTIGSVSPLLAQTSATQPAGTVFRDCSDCPQMVVLPEGSFQMGSMVAASEQPQRLVAVPEFAIGVYHVTQEQWTALMGTVPSVNKGLGLPVERVSWNDVQIFIQRLSSKTGKRYRLPSEAEWEYAARAGSTTHYSFGDDIGQLTSYAWFDNNALGKSQPVGKKLPNAFGLHDMHGNVWNWVEDCWHDSYSGAPVDGSAWTSGCYDSTRRVLRGGSWYNYPQLLRSAAREWNAASDRFYLIGFRVARSLTP